MKLIYSVLDAVRQFVKRNMHSLAIVLDKLSGGKLTPNTVTFISLAAHIPIAYFVANGQLFLGGLLLIFFGLFDALDGALARVQDRVSSVGMLLDSVTDRMKEITLYSGIAYYLVSTAAAQGHNVGLYGLLIAFALGGSVLVTYMNAWGEVVISGHQKAGHKVNDSLRTGLLGLEVRMFIVVVGLLTGWLTEAIIVIAIFAWVTAFERLSNILHRLKA